MSYDLGLLSDRNSVGVGKGKLLDTCLTLQHGEHKLKRTHDTAADMNSLEVQRFQYYVLRP